MLVAEGVVETSIADAHAVEQVLHGGRRVALAPEKLHGCVERLPGLELLGPRHVQASGSGVAKRGARLSTMGQWMAAAKMARAMPAHQIGAKDPVCS